MLVIMKSTTEATEHTENQIRSHGDLGLQTSLQTSHFTSKIRLQTSLQTSDFR